MFKKNAISYYTCRFMMFLKCTIELFLRDWPEFAPDVELVTNIILPSLFFIVFNKWSSGCVVFPHHNTPFSTTAHV